LQQQQLSLVVDTLLKLLGMFFHRRRRRRHRRPAAACEARVRRRRSRRANDPNPDADRCGRHARFTTVGTTVALRAPATEYHPWRRGTRVVVAVVYAAGMLTPDGT